MKNPIKNRFISLLLVFTTTFSICGCAAKAVPAPDVKGLELQGRNEKTTAVFNYIRDNFGEHILSAQQESTWMDSTDYEMDYLMDVTGKLPAIRGLDFMNDDFDGVAERAGARDE